MSGERITGGRWGCLLRLAVFVLAAVGVVVAIGTIFDQGDDADQPAHGYDAGDARAYASPSVNYAEAEHLYLTRLEDGDFIALYDKSTKQQELGGDCRVLWDDTAGVGTLAPLPGITGALVEECNSTRSVWRADGTFAFGSGYGDLDRLATNTDRNGHLIVDTESRSCTRSRGVIGVAPFDAKRCGKPD